MAQKFVQSTNPNFTVEAVPSYMRLPSGQFVPDGFTVNRRTDNQAVLGKVTDRYGLIQNSALLETAERAFKSKGLSQFKRNVIVVGQGEKMYATYTFENVTKKLKVGDEVGLRLVVQNSFDGSLTASLLAEILRLICTNGMVGGDKGVGLTKKHGSEIAVEFIDEALKIALGAFDSSIAIYDRLATVKLTQAQGHTILNRFKAANTLSEKLRESIAIVWDNPSYSEDNARNLYNLYNAVTQHLTRHVAPERYELAQRVSTNILTAFNRASLKSDAFAKLVTPINN